MLNKNFLYGFAAGFLGCKVYSNIKNNIRPMTLRIVTDTFTIKRRARSFIEEIKMKIQKQNNDNCNTVSKIDKQKDFNFLEEKGYALHKILQLRKQLENISKKVDNI